MSLKKTFDKMKGKEQARLDEELDMIARLGLTKEQKNALFTAAGEAMVKLPPEKFVAIMQACCPDTVVNGDLNHGEAVSKVVAESSIEEMKSIVEAVADATDDEEEKAGLQEMAAALTEKMDTDEESDDEEDEDKDDTDKDDKDEDDKKTVNESLTAIFGADLLTEETKDKIVTLFEAAIADQVATRTQAIEARLEEETALQVETLIATLDTYLEEAVDEFMEKNSIALETGIRVEMMENFMGGVKSLIEQNNFAINTDQVELVDELAAKVETLETRLNEELNEKVALKREIAESSKAAALAEAGKSLTVSEQEKLATLAEGLEFTTAEKFAGKLKIIVEQYFTTAPEKQADVVEGVLTEEKEIDPTVNRYVKNISNQLKK